MFEAHFSPSPCRILQCYGTQQGERESFFLYGLAFFVARGNYLTFSPVPENRGETLGTFVPKVRG